ncbi:hypothetical protein Cni_G23392 [Canna indica]|uniref:non-specific serine/threonine protein kinase n=1 Tax=Canna indica TaxID=4628 RepID=A0AAQ3L0A1_9LILI|nr:hypothetical protein Cni_G23392 [Canna indica]
MAAINSCLILLLLSVAVRVGGQFTEGLDFISLDCGTKNSHYVAPRSGIAYVSDEAFIDAGINFNISAAYRTVTLPQRYLSVRSFPSGARNCYTFKEMTVGMKYLIRPTFLYGNYDSKSSSSLQFDLHLGVNFWKTMNITDPSIAYSTEIIVEATTDLISVCLVNIGRGTPFISSLELRPLNRTLYPLANANLSLVLSSRFDLGRTSDYVRFPSDRHDRIWQIFNDTALPWENPSTNFTVQRSMDDHFEAPLVVMQTAVVPVNSTKLEISLTTDPEGLNEYYAVLHFAELQPLLKNESRGFFVYFGGNLSNDAKPFSPVYLSASAIYSTNPSSSSGQFNISLVATSNSTSPPMLNAVEVFETVPNTMVPSENRDVHTMMAIKEWYRVNKNWMGDPCVPKAYAWDGLNCTSDVSGLPRITAVNLSSSGLTGEITASFANLSNVQYLDLSYNQLKGKIPSMLAYLPELKFLNLANNQLNGMVPSPLLAKSQNGTLTLRIDGNPNICVNATSCEGKTKKKIYIIVVSCVVSVMLLVMAVILLYILRKKRARDRYMSGQNEYAMSIQNHRFTYTEVKKMTRNFERILGRGAFGIVYHGYLRESEVAVKMLSHTSSQEFVAEAQHLSRVHHRNLVFMMGYCIEGEHLALIYEYMSEGTLREHLRGSRGARPLSWDQRLRIAIEAAQGLEYLHTACKPPLIHRDVKTTNILLNERLEAKISDFGLSKAFENEEHSHVSTRVVGTPGYLDPEYYVKNQLSEKSDVFSFGVVLLELITGQPPILNDSEKSHIVQWACDRLAEGKIEEIVDVTLGGTYDVNSAWKMAYVALNCAMQSSSKRPTMIEVVIQLKEMLALQGARGRTQCDDTSTKNMLKKHGMQWQSGSYDSEYPSISDEDGPSAR